MHPRRQRDLSAAIEPGSLAGPQRTGVETYPTSDLFGALAPITERERDAFIGVSRDDQRRGLDASIPILDGHD